MPLLRRLLALSSACDQSSAVSLEEMVLHQRITDAVVMASLDVDGVVADIDYERAQILGVRDVLSSARDRKINLLSWLTSWPEPAREFLPTPCSSVTEPHWRETA